MSTQDSVQMSLSLTHLPHLSTLESGTPTLPLSHLLYFFVSLDPLWIYIIFLGAYLFIVYLPPGHSSILPSSQSLASGKASAVHWALNK